MQDEYEQQQFWLEEDPWKQLGVAISNYLKAAYNTDHHKTALSYLTDSVKTDNQTEYKWNINKNYEQEF